MDNEHHASEKKSSSINNYIDRLKKRIPYFVLLIHMYAVNNAFIECGKFENYIIPYLITINLLSLIWELWFISIAYYEIKKTMQLTCNCFCYVTFSAVSRLITFVLISNFATSGLPLRCVIKYPPEILNLVLVLFVGIVYMMDKIETHFWEPISDREQELETEADMLMGNNDKQITIPSTNESSKTYGSINSPTSDSLP